MMIEPRKFLTMLVLAQMLWIITSAPTASADGHARPGLKHHLTVAIDPAGHRIDGQDRIEFSNNGLSLVQFRLAKRIVVQSVRIDGKKAKYVFDAGLLRIALPPEMASVRLQINYGGVFDDPAPDQPLNTDNPGYGVTGTIQPRGTMLLAGSGWYPEAVGREETFDLTVSAPQGVVAVTSGNPLGHVTKKGRTFSRWSVDRDLRGLSLVAGPYQVSTRRFGNVTAATYFTKPLQHLSSSYLDATGRYLQFYEKLFGDYAFRQFAVVENFFPTGYGFPSFTLMGGRVLQLPFIIHTSLGHEIAHCWWGNGVLVDASQGNWCEGLTTYVADYLYKESRGEGREQRLQWLRDYANLVNAENDFPLSRFSGRTDAATRTIGYDKGAMVFHMLRQTVGDADFWRCLRGIYARYRFEAITWSDIRRAFEERSGRSLQAFFEQWVFTAGAPELSLARVTVKREQHGYAVNGFLKQASPYFDLDLELALRSDKETAHQTVSIAGGQTAFSILVAGRPLQLTVDPRIQVFRRLSPEEIPPTINTTKGSESICIVVARSQGPGGLDTAERLAGSLGLRAPTIGMENDFSARDLTGKDLLLVGLPSDRIWRPDHSDRFSVTADNFILNGRSYKRSAMSFFGVFKANGGRGGSVALFLPADQSLARTISAKITHYGKYSFLVFNAAENQVKGTWEVDRSPLTVRWADQNKS